MNRLDLLQVAGKYPPPPGDSEILGVEGIITKGGVVCYYSLSLSVSGVISAMSTLAKEKTVLKEGDKVMALVGGGGYAGK